MRCELGGCCAPNDPCASRSCAKPYGAISGAKMATRMNSAVRTKPVTSMPRWRPTLWRSWWTTGIRSRRRRFGVDAAMSVPHPRVDERGDDIHHEVGQGDDDREQHHHALDGDEVAGLHVMHQLEAEPFPLERRLGEHRAAEQ